MTLKKKLEAILKEHGDQDDASHDVYHARRVLATALKIAEAEGNDDDDDILTAAAYLHDLVNVPKNHPNRSQASAMSAKAAIPLLKEIGMPMHKIAAVCHAIHAHSFSANITPETSAAKIIQDADRLESLGAIGIARTFYVSGVLNRPLFDGSDPLAVYRPLDDQAYALDHFEAKLLTLAGTMQTETGKRIAEERTEFMKAFVAQIAEEAST